MNQNIIQLINLFKTVISQEVIPTSTTNDTHNKSKRDDFFYFNSDSDSDSQYNEPRSKAEFLISHFFVEESEDINLLERYPEIKNVFLKYNTPLPSSASVERLFSYATITNCPKANRLSDQMFEKRVVLKANLTYDEKSKQQ